MQAPTKREVVKKYWYETGLLIVLLVVAILFGLNEYSNQVEGNAKDRQIAQLQVQLWSQNSQRYALQAALEVRQFWSIIEDRIARAHVLASPVYVINSEVSVLWVESKYANRIVIYWPSYGDMQTFLLADANGLPVAATVDSYGCESHCVVAATLPPGDYYWRVNHTHIRCGGFRSSYQQHHFRLTNYR